MCGICGFIDKNTKFSKKNIVLKKMNDAMVHRGPDDAGEYFFENVALGMRRLSIIDLNSGHQPIHDESKKTWVVQNGEIYNFKSLRNKLEKKGHKFYTNSDTEVIVHLYKEYGEKFCEHLDGMFAIAVFDQTKNKLIIARDRAGQKPLYYSDTNSDFVFGSEMKVMLQHPEIKKEINTAALQQYLMFACTLTPNSIFKGVKKLKEGHYLVVENGVAGEPKPFWKYNFPEKFDKRSESEWIELIDSSLIKAVEKRLISDVPLGVFLSGGVDSSLISAMMCKIIPPEKVNTFSIKVDDPIYDESKWSRWAADHLKTNHTEFNLSVDSMIDILDKVLDSLDEPMADSSILPTYAVSHLTRQKVTVALGGDGGDEVFGGYPKYFAQRIAGILEKIPAPLRKYFIEKPLSIIPAKEGGVFFNSEKISSFFHSLHHNFALRNQFWVSAFQPEQIEELTGSALLNESISPVLNRMSEYSGPNDIVAKTLFQDYKILMQDDFNVKVDRASMLTSLEVREPFMDTELVELVAKMPSHFKVKGMETKYLLKKVAEKYFPKDFIYRKKWGFGVPIKRWIRGNLRGKFEDVLSPKNVKNAGLVNHEICTKLLEEHLSEKHNHAGKLWSLFVLHNWYEKWGA